MTRTTKILILIAAFVSLLGIASSRSYGFGEIQGSCESDCQRCHHLTVEEATSVVKEINPEIEVVSVALSPVGGLWEVIVKARGKRSLAYVDFSKQYLITGDIIKVSTKKNVTDERIYDLSRIDVTAIPLDEALLMGRKDARFKVIVFDDPD